MGPHWDWTAPHVSHSLTDSVLAGYRIGREVVRQAADRLQAPTITTITITTITIATTHNNQTYSYDRCQSDQTMLNMFSWTFLPPPSSPTYFVTNLLQ